jgi:hypothetical protein
MTYLKERNIIKIHLNKNIMDLKKELLEFLEANNNFGLEEPEKLVDIYIKVYKEGLGINYFKKQEQ